LDSPTRPRADPAMTIDERSLTRAPRQPYEIAPSTGIGNSMVTTAFVLDGYRVVKSLGVVRGIVVRSRSLVGNIGAAFQVLFGGNITLLTSLCERARQDAFHVMIEHAVQVGANAVIGMRYDATEIMNGATQVIAYATAVL